MQGHLYVHPHHTLTTHARRARLLLVSALTASPRCRLQMVGRSWPPSDNPLYTSMTCGGHASACSWVRGDVDTSVTDWEDVPIIRSKMVQMRRNDHGEDAFPQGNPSKKACFEYVFHSSRRDRYIGATYRNGQCFGKRVRARSEARGGRGCR